MNTETAHTDTAEERRQPGPGPRTSAAPTTATERAVAEIWEEVLDRKGIGVTDDFFDLGGTSLDLIRVFFLVNAKFGLAMYGSVLEDEATIARLAKCVEAERRR